MERLKAQSVRYLISGAVNTIIAFIVFVTMVSVFMAPAWLANFLGVSLSTISGYLLSANYVFKPSTKDATKSSARYVLVIALQYILSTGLIYLLLAVGFNKVLSYILMLPAAVLFSYKAQKLWVFKNEKPLT